MTQEDVIKHWADRWRSLRAWRGALAPMQFKFESYKGRGYVGQASCDENRATIRLTGVLYHDLATVLHELAHLAAPRGEGHGPVWRELFVAATAEAFQMLPDEFEVDVKFDDLDRQVEDAVKHWLVRSGQEVVLRAIGALS